ncbi:MAG: GT-D fold domain-containing glycosyltransferase [Paenibacillus sp.]|uniref:GT-D fold domain-containing protein n=1 Tax=Paenibacillus sp. TaxID=58172 RepID=UPI00290B5781|nr:GT-D fold domain-containing glycosyltransferase [Paenibacillus sp.]MDU4696606.1 GT-D fold domain-containing glycosyltransferase [Paenibacillus sp.]
MASRDNPSGRGRTERQRRGASQAAAAVAGAGRRTASRSKAGRTGRAAGKGPLHRRRASSRRLKGRRGIRASAWRRAQRLHRAANGAARRLGVGVGGLAEAATTVAPNPAALTPPPTPAPEPAGPDTAPVNGSEVVWSAAEAERVRAAAFEEGYREGLFEGGEAKLGRLIPRHTLLPELRVDDVIAAGFTAVAGRLHPLLPPSGVFAAADGALREGRPLSVVRLGDGELITLAHGTVISTEEALRWGAFLPYAGVQLPDPAAREALAAAVRAADIIGVPESRHPSYQGLLFPVLRHYGIDYRALRMTTSTVNYELNASGLLTRLMYGRRVLLIGNQAEALAGFLGQRGVHVVGWLAPVQGVADAPAVAMRVRECPDFDLALVSAGVAAVMICAWLSLELGKVALDMGHLADKLIKGEAAWPQLGEVHTGANGN